MPRRVLLGHQKDFTGGINFKADPFSLGGNESPDLLNVDVDPRGGFGLRRGVSTFGDAAGGEVHSILEFRNTTGTHEIIIGVGASTLKRGSGAAWTSFVATRVGPLRYAIFKDKVYIQNGVDGVLRWDGTTETVLAEPAPANWNNDLAAPTIPPANGEMPIAKVAAVHQGCVFVANTLENGTAFKNRVRWSHPNFPEDWVDFHFIDVDTGQDGDEIVALVPHNDRLLVFKKHSCFAIYGEPPDRFQIQNLSREMGTVSQESVVVSDYGVYFWAFDNGVYLFNGRDFIWQFDRLMPVLQDGSLTIAQQAKVVLGWGNRRLWAAVPFEGSTVRSHVFVLDPTLTKLGSWVLYDLPIGPFLWFRPLSSDPLLLAAHVGGTRVLRLDQDAASDNFGAGVTAIASHYMTRWFDLDAPAIEKRWRHPEIVTQDEETADIIVQTFKDYNSDIVRREFVISTSAAPTTLVWEPTLAEGQWDQGTWAGEDSIELVVHRGSMIGNARAVALKFIGPFNIARWVVDSISMKYIPKRLR